MRSRPDDHFLSGCTGLSSHWFHGAPGWKAPVGDRPGQPRRPSAGPPVADGMPTSTRPPGARSRTIAGSRGEGAPRSFHQTPASGRPWAWAPTTHAPSGPSVREGVGPALRLDARQPGDRAHAVRAAEREHGRGLRLPDAGLVGAQVPEEERAGLRRRRHGAGPGRRCCCGPPSRPRPRAGTTAPRRRSPGPGRRPRPPPRAVVTVTISSAIRTPLRCCHGVQLPSAPCMR